jgi:hypothetical protein
MGAIARGFLRNSIMAPTPGTQPQTDAPEQSVAERFRRLADAWHAATGHLSSMSRAASHPAYQEIIGLGPEVVPLLLRDLEDRHSHWFSAIRELTGANPIPPEAAGNIPAMAAAWLGWAREQGYRW